MICIIIITKGRKPALRDASHVGQWNDNLKTTTQSHRCYCLDTGNTADLLHSSAGAVPCPPLTSWYTSSHPFPCVCWLWYMTPAGKWEKDSLLGFALQTSHSALLLQYFSWADACSPSPCRRMLAPPHCAGLRERAGLLWLPEASIRAAWYSLYLLASRTLCAYF